MKKTILLTILITLPFLVFCQNMNFKNWRLGMMLNTNIHNNDSNFEPHKNYINFSYNLQFAHKFTERWEMEIGLGLSKRVDQSEFFTCTFCEVIPSGNVFGDFFFAPAVTLRYLDLSVMGNYYFKKFKSSQLYATAGVGYSLLRSKDFQQTALNPVIYKRLLVNPAVGLGIEIQLAKWIQMRYQSTYTFATSNTNNIEGNPAKAKLFTMSFGLSIPF